MAGVVGMNLEMVVGTQGAALWVDWEVGRMEGVKEEEVALEEAGVMQVVGAH